MPQRSLTRRGVLLGAPVVAAAAAAPALVEVDPRIATFHRHWDKFLRAYLGCPAWAETLRECDLQRGLWDYPEFVRAAKAARELFEIK